MGANTIAKLTKWTILDPKRMTNRDVVSPFNYICLKSPFGHYFQVESNNLVSANGQDISERCMFKMVKADIPHLPDWLFKRPYLNHNNITDQYKPFIQYPQTGNKV